MSKNSQEIYDVITK